MELAAAYAIAAIAREEVSDSIKEKYRCKLKFGSEYLLPKPGDKRLITEVSIAVAKAAMESGVARRRIASFKEYAETLHNRIENENFFAKELLRHKNSGKRNINNSSREREL